VSGWVGGWVGGSGSEYRSVKIDERHLTEGEI
jgi:hypothetical protein